MSDDSLQQTLVTALEHHREGRLEQAELLYRQVLLQRPDDPDALHLLGVAAHQQGRHAEAAELIQRVVNRFPDSAMFHNSLSAALLALGAPTRAAQAARTAASIDPNLADAYANLAAALHDLGDSSGALGAAQRAIALEPLHPQAHNTLGNALVDAGRVEEAITAYQVAISQSPQFAEAYANLGSALLKAHRMGEAADSLEAALRLNPRHVEAWGHLSAVRKQQGLIPESVELCRRALKIDPDYQAIHSNLLYELHFHPDLGPAEIFAMHRDWARRYADPLEQAPPPPRRDRSRPRIGYVSGDFRDHPVGRTYAVLAEHHDRDAFEIYCYQSSNKTDWRTQKMRAKSDAWREVAKLSDAELARLVREDEIDVLVDLSQHTEHNRLLVVARRPAPIQVSYLGYPATTGLTQVDYRFTDANLDPPGMFEPFNTERLARLPNFLCVAMDGDEPPVGPSPAERNGYITFGSLNNTCKISRPTIKLWSGLLRALPDAQLLMLASDRDRARDLLVQAFVSQGIAAERIDTVPPQSRMNYLATYGRIDIALDPLPYHGHMTSVDAMMMGCPVVSLIGHTSVGRAGLSLLNTMDLDELVAQTPEQFVEIASSLAMNIPGLSRMRRELRERFVNSALCDGAKYTSAIESLYREMLGRD